MKYTCLLLCLFLLGTGCSYKVQRTGYDLERSQRTVCDLVIKKDVSIGADVAEKIGEIKLGEAGFTVGCSEDKALEIIKGEACAIGAQLVIITDEKRPNVGSSCYRCSASFYKLLVPLDLVSDEAYSEEQIKTRSKDDKSYTLILIGSIMAGILVALLIL